MRTAAGIAVMFFVAACGGGGTAAAHTTPSQGAALTSPSAGASPSIEPSAQPSAGAPASPVALAGVYGVVVKDFLTDGGPTYTASLVREDGQVQASVTANKRVAHGWLVQEPNISASNSRLYYLDGDANLRFLKPDGTTGAVKTLPVEAAAAAIFAVSPDDTRIAVAIITYPYPVKTRIYVEDLYGTTNHVELFSSSSVMEWPVGWHQGRLVIGIGMNAAPQNAWDGFSYTAGSYHVANAATATRLATICPNGFAGGTPTPAGTACWSNSSETVSDWSGITRPVPAGDGCRADVLSTDGQMVADFCNDGFVRLVTATGGVITTPYTATPQGWIDRLHVVLLAQSGQLSILNVQLMQNTTITAS